MGFFDNFRKKVKGKYDIKPEENVTREVYGIPNPSKYDVNPKNNIPEKVYGIKVVDRNSEMKRCTKCGSVLKKYIYGKVTGEIDTTKYALGGCIISENAPEYRCSNCNIDFDKNGNSIDSSLEKAIVECVGQDPFWSELIRKYFEEDVKYDEKTAVELLKIVARDKEIFNEFTKYLVKKSYDIEKPIKVDGISARDLASKNPNKSAIEVYAMLGKFKNR